MAVSNLAMYVNGGDGSTTGWYAVTAWATGTSKTVGQIVRQNAAPAVNSERCFVCIVAGTTHASTEPTWTTTVGAKTTDNTVTWMECTGNPALNGDVTNIPASSTWRSTSTSLGQVIKNNAADHYHICTTAGSTGSGEPTFSTTTGGTTTDSTVTWTCLGAVSSFTTIWAAPARRLQVAHTMNAGNTSAWNGYVAAAHTETYSATTTITGAGSSATPPVFLCVASSPGSIPPGGADVTTGASITSSSGTLTMNGGVHYWGFTFGSPSVTVGSTQSTAFRLTNCTLNLTTGTLSLGGNYTRVEFVNTTANWSGAGSSISPGGGTFRWRDTSSALSYASTMSASLFGASAFSVLECIGVDFSAWTGTNPAVTAGATGARASLVGCKFASTVTLTTTATLPYAYLADFVNCDSGGAIYRHERGMAAGTQRSDATIYRSGGASDGSTAISWKIANSTAASFDYPFESMPMGFWNTTTGSAVTLTVEGLYVGAAAPTTAQVWIEAEYFGTSSSTRLSRATTAVSNPLTSGSAGTASTATWTNNATARANTHTYAAGDAISVSSNASLIFVCTTGGTSSGSLPGAYASATEGTSVTDGGATFRAAVRFKMAVACSSPQSAGFVRAIVKAAVASAYIYVDPYITVS